MTPNLKQQYVRIRNGWALSLAVVWIVYRISALREQRRVALAALTDCSGFLHGTGCAISRGVIDGKFDTGVVGAVLLAPLALVVGHYIARWMVERQQAAEQASLDAARAATTRAQQEEQALRQARIEGDASQARQSLDRGEFIHKLGAVGDFVDLLAHETDPTRIATIRLGAAQALRDLVAKHSLDQLTTIVASDTSVRMSLANVMGRLASVALDSGAEAAVLRAALNGAGSSQASFG